MDELFSQEELPQTLSATERLRQLKDYLNIRFSDLSLSIGIPPQNLYNIDYGKAGISKNIAQKICTKYPEISFSWLLSGQGSMLTNPIDENKRVIEVAKSKSKDEETHQLRLVEVMKIQIEHLQQIIKQKDEIIEQKNITIQHLLSKKD